MSAGKAPLAFIRPFPTGASECLLRRRGARLSQSPPTPAQRAPARNPGTSPWQDVAKEPRHATLDRAGGQAWPLLQVAELLLDGGDVLLVHRDRVLKRLDALLNPSVVALFARALRLLIGQDFLRLHQRLLLARQLLLEDLAPILVAL